MRRLLRSLFAASSILLTLGSCSGDTPSGGNVLVVSAVEITPAVASLIVGATEQLTAVGKTSGGVVVTGRPTTWSSSNTAIVSVSTTGLLTARAVGGPVTITATIDRVSATIPVTVVQKPVGSVTVTPAEAQVTIGGAQQFTAVLRADDGEVLTGRTVSWESLAPAIASVNASTGAAVGVAQGTAAIRASSEGKLGTASLVVGARPASRLGFTTQPPTATAGQPFGPVRVSVQDDIGGTIPGATTAITLSLADNPGNGTLGGTLTANAVQGVATFTDLVLNRAATGYTLRASALALSPGISNPFAVAPGAAAALAMATQPSASAQSGVTLAQQPTVQLRDALGNAVPQAGVVVTVALVGTTGTLGGTPTATTNASGLASFTGLAIAAPTGSYTLRFTAPGLTEATSAAIAIGAGTGARLGVTTQPSSAAQSGTPFPQQPVVQIQDASGNPVAQAGVAVTAVIGSGGGSLIGTSTVTTNASGVASFAGLGITGPAGSYTLAFSAPGLAGATSATITLGAGSATALVMVTQPSASSTNGTALLAQPSVRLADGAGNSVSQAGVVVTASVSGGATVTSGGTAVTNASGVATFAGLTLTGTVGSYAITFSVPGLSSITSVPVTLLAGPASQLVVSRQPSSGAQSGTAFSVQPQVQVADQSGNPVAVAGVTVTAALASGAGTIGGTLTATTSASGLATFTDLAITGPSGTYTIRFTAAGYTSVVSAVVGLGAGVATQLAITTQPAAAAQSGVAFTTQPVIQLRDAANNVVAQAGTVVTAEIASGGGTLGGTLTATTNASGVATFTNLSIAGTVGARTLRFTATGLTDVTSGTITLSAGPAATIGANSSVSQTATAGSAVTAAPSVVVQDASGNPVSGVSVVFTVTAGGGSTAPASPATVVTGADGIATLTSWTTGTTAGANTLTAAATGLTGSPVTFSATGTAGTATALAATTSTNQSAQVGTAVAAAPTVRVTDVNGNPVAGVVVTFAVATGGGTISPASPASVTTNASGVAALTSWTLGASAGPNTVTATAAGLTGSPVTFTATGFAGSATTIAANSATSQTAAVSAPVAAAPSVRVTDGSGNGVAGVPVAFAVTAGGGTTVPASPAIVTTDASGVASLTSWTLGAAAGANTVQASAGSLSGSPVSFNATGTAGTASRLALTTAPSATAQSGVALVQQPVIQVQDGGGNPVADAGVVVTAEIASGGGTLGGTVTATTNASGVATFTNLALSGTAGNRTLRFTAAGLTSVTSGTIALTAGPASVIAAQSVTTQGGMAGTAVGAPPSVLVTDASGNVVSGVSVTYAVASGGGAVNGAASAVVTTNASGLATLTSWTLGTTAGANTVTATATGLTGSPVTFSATGAAGAATQVALTTAPSTSVRNAVALATQPVAQLRDQYGNAVAQASVTVTATTTAGVALTNATATTNASGVATFSGLTLTGTTGSYVLTFAAPTLTSVAAPAITVTAGGASKLALTTPPPATAQSEVAFVPQPVVQVQDVSGNALDTALTVTATITSQPGLASSLNNSSASTGGGNSATFSGMSIQGITGTYTLRFAAGSLTPVTGVTVTLTAGGSAALQMVVQPSATATNGEALATVPQVRLVDGIGNPVSQSGVTITVTAGAATVSAGGSALTNASGVATFTGLTLTGTTGNYTLSFASTGLTDVTSSSVALGVGAASKLVIATAPSSSAESGVAFGTQPVIQVQDVGGNVVTGSSAAITASKASGSGTVAGTATVNAVNGVATFTTLRLDGAGDHTLTFASGALTSATSGTISVSQVARSLEVTTQPAGAVSGVNFTTQPVVRIKDAAGLLVTTGSGATLTVRATVSSGGGTLAGTGDITASGGIATFTNLKITGTGSHVLQFAALTTSLTVLSSSFVVEAPPAAGIRLNVGASSVVSGTVNGELTVPLLVDMTDRGTQDIASITVRVTWDPAKVAYVSNSAGNWIDGAGSGALTFPNADSVTAGIFRISGLSTSATTTSFTLRNLVLKPLVAGDATVAATVPAAGNEAGEEITVTPRNLTVTSTAALREAVAPLPITPLRRARGRT